MFTSGTGGPPDTSPDVPSLFTGPSCLSGTDPCPRRPGGLDVGVDTPV